MTHSHTSILILIGFMSCCTGCVERRLLIDTNPPHAKVFLNNKPVGFAPVDVPFVYYGKYQITLEYPGYQTRIIQEDISAPLYEYPPVDFLSETLLPFRIRDKQEFYYIMDKNSDINLDQLKLNANELRERGRQLPPPTKPVEKPPRNPPAADNASRNRNLPQPAQTEPPPTP